MNIHIPNDKQIEIFCLSAMMNNINAANEGFGALDDSDFFDSDHKKIFILFKQTFNADYGCSLETMVAALKKPEGNFSLNYLLNIDSQFWTGMPYEDYFSKLKNLSSLRKAIYAANELLLNASKSGAEFDSIIADHQNKIMLSMGISQKTLTPRDLLEEFRKDKGFIDYALWKRERYHQGLPTYDGVLSGYPILDATLGSFQNGGIYYIGARTSMGKTTFILNIMSKILATKKIGIFSLEMDARMIFEKLLCIHCDIKYSKFSLGNFTDEEIDRIRSLETSLKDRHIFIEDEQALSISKLAARAKRMKNNHGIEILFVDYLTLIKANTNYPTKHMQVDEVSKGLQSLAKALKIPVICLAQLNRSSVSTNEKSSNRPSLSHFRESGSIEEDADGCLLLHRPEYYNRIDKPGLIEVIVAKNRIMGTLTTIDFSCTSLVSERYHELPTLEQERQKQRDKEFDDAIGVPQNRYEKSEVY